MPKYKPNDLFHNRYKLLKLVGKGGMSEIWTALDEHGDEEEVIALKIYDDNVDRKSLNAEYALMRKFNHPNLLRPDYFVSDDNFSAPFMVMKYYSKGSASEIINNSVNEIKPIDEKLVAQFILSAAKALYTIQKHEKKIIHQDIKPDNFLINDDGSFVLADFGVSTVSKATRKIKNGNHQFSGSAAYVAPERFKGAPPRFSQDIFSLGVSIYEILTGVLPFQEHGGIRLNQGFPVPDLDPAFGYSARLNAICKRCMDVEPDARPLTTELIEWAEFYIKNGYWPEIPQIDTNLIKAEKLYRNTKLSYDRITKCKINELDRSEVLNCIGSFKNILLMNNVHFNVESYLSELDRIKNDLEYFENLENQFFRLKDNRPEKKKVNELRKKYFAFGFKISEEVYKGRLIRIEELSAEALLLDEIEEQLKKHLSRPVNEYNYSDIKVFIEKNRSAIYFKSDIAELEKRVASFIEKKQESILIKEKAKTLAEEAGNLLFLVKNEKDPKLNKIQIQNCIEKFKDSLSLVYDKAIEIELSEAIKEKERLEKDETEEEKQRNEYNIEQADNLYEIVNLYIDKKEYTTKTLKENLRIIDEAINIYSASLLIDPGIIEIKRNKAFDLREILLEELRKKRRGVFWGLLKGAAVFVLIMIIYLVIKYYGGNEIEPPTSTGGSQGQAIGGNQVQSTDGNEGQAIGGNQVQSTDGNESQAIGGNQVQSKGGNEGQAIGGNQVQSTDGNEGQAIGGNQVQSIAGNQVQSTGGSEGQAIGGNRVQTIAGNQVKSTSGNEGQTTVENQVQSTRGGVVQSKGEILAQSTAGGTIQSNEGNQMVPNSCAPQIIQKKTSYRISKNSIELTCESPCGDGDFIYEWKMVRGEKCELGGQNTSTLVISNYIIGDYEFRLVKKNKNGVEISSPIYYSFKVKN